MRLDRLLADMNIGTRKELKKLIRNGQVVIDGAVAHDPGMNVTGREQILLGGRQISYNAFEYYMLNKPAGILSATRDPKRQTVLDLLPAQHRRDLFPVGRLDIDTVGLMLITNDGRLAHELLSPKHHVDKTYLVRVDGILQQADADAFAAGFKVDEELTAMPAEMKIQPPGDQALVTIREGKFHQIRRMFAARGFEVQYLKRLSIGPLQLDPALPEGSCRLLAEKEVRSLYEHTEANRSFR